MAPVEAQLRDDIKTHLEKVMEALEAHPLWSEKPPSLFFLWDFVNTGVSMLTEYDNILNGRPLQNPNKVRPAPTGTGENAALKVFQEVCGRTMMLEMIVNDTSGRMAMMTGSSGPPIDYGDNVKQAVKNLEAVVPKEHLLAGMMK